MGQDSPPASPGVGPRLPPLSPRGAVASYPQTSSLRQGRRPPVLFYAAAALLLFLGGASVSVLHTRASSSFSSSSSGRDGSDAPLLESSLRRIKQLEAELASIRSTMKDLRGIMSGVTRRHEKEGGKKGQEGIKAVESMQADEKKQSQQQRDKSRRRQRRDPNKPLNILLLYADDWRYDTLGAAGNPIVKTPVFDELAQKGVRFTENCVTTSICWCSRATLYTGQYLARHKFALIGKTFLPPKNETIYALLKKKGYHVGHAGKLGVWTDIGNREYFDYLVDEDGWHYREYGKKMWHITEKNEADALRFLAERPKDKPFFLNVAFFATHAVDGDKRQYMPQNRTMSMYVDDTIPVPATATDEAWMKMPDFFTRAGARNEGRTRWEWRYDTPEKHQSMMKNYYRMASEVDTASGAVLDELERQGVLDDTLIIFTTDNGNFHAEHGLADKWYPHQESIRVPLIVVDPRMDSDKVGTTNDDFTLNTDLAPTILGAAGIDALPSMMGRDMSVLYRDGDAAPWRTEFFYEHPIISHKEYIPSSEALVRKDYKYFYWPDYDVEQLFDLRKDPGEIDDLIKSEDPKVVAKVDEMRKRFRELKDLVHSNGTVVL